MGEIIYKNELITTTLNGLTNLWDSFAVGICARKDTPRFEELWTSCTQEDYRIITKGNIQRHDEGESQAFVARYKRNNDKKKFVYKIRMQVKNPISKERKTCLNPMLWMSQIWTL